ncbi:MAG: sensor histidine kinase [Flavobacteriales bacterium]
MGRTDHRSLWMLGFALAYLIAQSSWWAVLLLRREAEVAALRGEAAGNRSFMVLGEAGVLMALLAAIAIMAFLAIRRDLRMAALQRNFLLAVTHELRTPIASIKLQLQTLARPGLTPDWADALRAAALAEADRLGALTEKVLLAAAEGSGAMPLRKQPIDAAAELRLAAERARQHDRGTHRIVAELPAELHVMADPLALRSIADNLLENAMKYSPAGTAITLKAADAGQRWSLEGADEGPGIPAQERSKVFERFYRSGGEETRQHRGTGLGLHIVERLVRGHGGTIAIRDARPSGAIFAATFPKT